MSNNLESLLDDALDDIVNADYTKFSQATEQDEEDYISELTAQYDKTFQDFLSANPEFETQGIDDEDEGNSSLDENIRLTVEELMKNTKPGGIEGEEAAEGSESGSGVANDMIPMLEGLLGKLLSREILQEPLEELLKLYPDWLESNTEHPQIETYKKQKDIVSSICEIFQTPGSEYKSSEVFRLLNTMQETGPPPQEIVDQMSQDMPPNLTVPPPTSADQCSVM